MIEFVPLKHSDTDTIISMMEDFYAIDNYPIDRKTTRKLFETFINDENLGKCWLISYNNSVVGYLILTYIFSFEYQGRIAFLDELYLNEAARGKRIGHAALKFVHKNAEENNLKVIYLEIESHNEVAKNLYLSNDFVVHNRQIMKLITKP